MKVLRLYWIALISFTLICGNVLAAYKITEDDSVIVSFDKYSYTTGDSAKVKILVKKRPKNPDYSFIVGGSVIQGSRRLPILFTSYQDNHLAATQPLLKRSKVQIVVTLENLKRTREIDTQIVNLLKKISELQTEYDRSGDPSVFQALEVLKAKNETLKQLRNKFSTVVYDEVTNLIVEDPSGETTSGSTSGSTTGGTDGTTTGGTVGTTTGGTDGTTTGGTVGTTTGGTDGTTTGGTGSTELDGSKNTLSEIDFLVVGRHDLSLTSSTYTGYVNSSSIQLQKISDHELGFIVPDLGPFGSKTLTVTIDSITYEYSFNFVARTLVSNPSAEINSVEQALSDSYDNLEAQGAAQANLDYLADMFLEYQAIKALLDTTEQAEMISIFNENFGEHFESKKDFKKLSIELARSNFNTPESFAAEVYQNIGICKIFYATVMGTVVIGVRAFKDSPNNKVKAVGALAAVALVTSALLCEKFMAIYTSQMKFLNQINSSSIAINFNPPWGTDTGITGTYRSVNSGDVANVNSLPENPKTIVKSLLGLQKVFESFPVPAGYFNISTYSGETFTVDLPGYFVVNVIGTNGVTFQNFYGQLDTYLYANALSSRTFDFTIFYFLKDWSLTLSQTFAGNIIVSK